MKTTKQITLFKRFSDLDIPDFILFVQFLIVAIVVFTILCI